MFSVPKSLNCGLYELETDDRILEVESVIIFNQSIDEVSDRRLSMLFLNN